jgi:hypothetical protein
LSLAACFSSPTTGAAYLRLPEYLDDYVTEDNPMRVIDVVADELDLGALLLALSPTSSSQMISDLMELQPVILESLNAMNAAYGATIERRIRINRPDDENTRCKVSRAWIRAKISLSACSSLQHFQRPAPSHLSKNAPSLQGIGHADVA